MCEGNQERLIFVMMLVAGLRALIKGFWKHERLHVTLDVDGEDDGESGDDGHNEEEEEKDGAYDCDRGEDDYAEKHAGDGRDKEDNGEGDMIWTMLVLMMMRVIMMMIRWS